MAVATEAVTEVVTEVAMVEVVMAVDMVVVVMMRGDTTTSVSPIWHLTAPPYVHR